MSMGETIKNLRKEQHVTQEELAAVLDISPQSISKWENGTSNPDITYIPIIADFFKVAIESLFIEDNNNQKLNFEESQDRCKKLLASDDIESIIDIWENMCFKYPNDYRIAQKLVLALCTKGGVSVFDKIFKYMTMILKSNQNKTIENETIETVKNYMIGLMSSHNPTEIEIKTNVDSISQNEIDIVFSKTNLNKVENNRVLIVDDVAFMRMLQSDLLSKNGYEIIGEAENGIEAIELYKKLSPDIVIMDIKMPELDGISASKEILSINPKASIIICSAMAEKAVIDETKKIGVCGFVKKPFYQESFLKQLNSLI